MRRTMIGVLMLAVAAGVMSVRATQAPSIPSAPSSATAPLLEWPLPAAEKAYGRIDGRHLHHYVEEQAAISRRYRDQGHPKFWGRIIGSSADAESAEWLANKFKSPGMSDVRIQPLDLSPQWFPEKWDVTVAFQLPEEPVPTTR